MLVQALLVALWAGLCSLDDGGIQLQIRKPLLAGTVTGLLLGDLEQGLIIGGTLELMWLGVNSVGAYNPPDITGGAIIGTVAGITSGGGVSVGVAFAVPAATLILQLVVLLQTYLSVHIHRAEAVAKTGDFDKVNRWHLLSGVFLFLVRAVPCFIAVFLGNTILQDFIDWLPTFITDGLTVASGMIPAVGISMLLTMMLKKNMWMYLVAGFVCAAYLGLPILGVSLVGLVFAGIHDYNFVQNKRIEESINSMEVEGGIDL
ncbi:PTS sugar transporter subunit IIC [Faecalicoccus acidiformans]|uniref:PTS mannose/fructose/sorbose/N-acetylgalactosamine transporter subunit IIC n=1 Tax=Faecalicoccus acidiformans TaxID=915173 RepID=UPI0025A3E6FD|nr:PTS sugar transporter subunit IIC [Faecalicoccus acidiformans]MDM8203876.1 PTS sugar transporter subunit IIC [Faecalicoccus acidiformans]